MVDVDVVSRGHFERLAVTIGLKDSNEYLAFHVSSESLTGSSFTMEADEAVTCTFELDLHLAAGRYRICTWVYRYDSQTNFDHWPTAATIFVSSASDVHGLVNLYPTVHFGPKHLVSRTAEPPVATDPRPAAPPDPAGTPG